MPARLAIVAAALLCAAPGCRSSSSSTPTGPEEPRACTMEFRTYATHLVDAAGQPVTGATLDVKRANGTSILCRTEGERGCLPPGEVGGYGAPGSYTLMSDAVTVSTAGETFSANLTAPDGRAIAGTFRFSHDGCHVRKLSGPDTLRLLR